MLWPENEEETLWKYRPWLLWWYELADRLFAYYDIRATSPSPDWFLRPTAATFKEACAVERVSILSRCQGSHVRDLSTCETVIHNSPFISGTASPARSEEKRGDCVESLVPTWLDCQPDVMDIDNIEFLDLAPLPPTILQPSNPSQTSASGLNPLASEFLPAATKTSIARNGKVELAERLKDTICSEAPYADSDSGISGMSTPDESLVADMSSGSSSVDVFHGIARDVHLDNGLFANSDRIPWR